MKELKPLENSTSSFNYFTSFHYFIRSISLDIQLFRLTLSDQNKAKRQDRNVLWDYFL